MNLRLVTLDATNTIIRFSKPPSYHYAKVASLYGVQLNVKELDNSFKKSFKKHTIISPNFGVGDNGYHCWWSNVIKDTFAISGAKVVDSTVLTNISDHLITLFATSETYEIVPGFPSLIEYLSKLGVIIGTISNTDERLEQILTELKIRHYFHFILTSYSARVVKPDPAIFQCAISRSGKDIKPSEALHIGDTLEVDYLGAKEAKWNSILVSPTYEQQCKKLNVKINKKCMVPSLPDVCSTLKTLF